MQYFDVETKKWRPLPTITPLTEATACYCAEYAGNFFYVAAKKGNDFVSYRYNTVSNTWETLPPFFVHGVSDSKIDYLCFVDNYLYAISGGSTCYKYTPAKNNWQRGAHLSSLKFGCPSAQQSNVAAEVWKSCIYVLHGLTTSEDINIKSNSSGFSLAVSATSGISAAATSGVSAPSSFGVSTPSPFGMSAAATSGVSAPSSFGMSTPAHFGMSAAAISGVSAPSTFGVSTPPFRMSAAATSGVSAPPSSFGVSTPPFGISAATISGVSAPSSFGVGASSFGASASSFGECAPAPNKTAERENNESNSSGFFLAKPKPAEVHCFDPTKNEWLQKASTCHPHFGSSLFVVDNRLYVAGGSTSSQVGVFGAGPAPVEVYDEQNNTWSVVEQNHIPPNNLGAVEMDGRVYFIVNKFPVDVGIRIPPGEVYDMCLNEWENLAQISEHAVLCYLPVKTEGLKADVS